MKYEEYKELYNSLKTARDVRALADRYDERLLDTLFTQKTSREVKKRFYVVKQNTPKMLKEWTKGKSIMQLSEKYRFPPILTAMFIFLEDGASKKEFWSYIHDPDLLESEETADEVREAIANDIVYSPEANDRQRERGLWGEDLLHQWLDGQGITYRTQNDLRGTEFRFNSRKQLVPYTQLFGPGLVVYWVGCLDDLECPENVYVSDISVMDVKLEKVDPEE